MPHTRSPPFRRRIQWSSLLPLLTILTISWLPWTQAQQQPAAEDFLVDSLPGAPSPLLKMYAGHIEIAPEHHGNLFFWLVQNRHNAQSQKQKTVIWLNGGPGCSSMDGALMEIGPYRVRGEDETVKLEMNDGSWDEYANVLFVDNPVGTGFSYVDGDALVSDLDVMADQFVTFLEKWFAIFPKYSRGDLYLAGESYAGQHIPYIAKAVVDRNAKHPIDKQWHLSGLMIGNGWISGEDQYTSYIPFALETNILQSDSKAYNDGRTQEELCLKKLAEGGNKRVDTSECEIIMMGLNRDLRSADGQCFNVYDVRLKDSYPSCGMNWPPDLVSVTPYLRREDVTRALHINPDKKTGWTECNNQVSGAFRPRSLPSKTLLPGLLEKMPIILFSGDKDLICNHIGTENLIENLEWNGDTGMQGESLREWTFDNEPAGQYQMARNLTYIRFYNSSHMVPFDYPKRTRDMLDRFIGDGKPTFADSYIEGLDDKEEVEVPSTGGSKLPPAQSPPSSVDGKIGDGNETEEDRIQAAKWEAYQRSGEAALVVVVIAATAWGIFVWRGRRRRRAYKSVSGSDPYDGGGSGGRFRDVRSRLGLGSAAERFRKREQDEEAAREFDEAELDDLSPDGLGKERYALTDDDDEEDEGGGGGSRRANGRP